MNVRRALWRAFPQRFNDPNLDEWLASWCEGDADDNDETSPPDDETIRVWGLTAVEIFTPGNISNLIHGLEQLEVRSSPSWRSPAKWVKQQRESASGGGYHPLGVIIRPDDARTFVHACRGPLPHGIDYAIASIQTITSSLTALVVTFVLADERAPLLENALRKVYATTASRRGKSGYAIHHVENLKVEQVDRLRAEMRRQALTWFRSHFPGYFSTDDGEPEFTTCELTVFRNAEPFPPREKRQSGRVRWRWILGMDSDFFVWQVQEVPLRFAWPLSDHRGSRFHAALVGREQPLLSLSANDEEAGSPAGSVSEIEDYCFALFGVLGVLGLLASFERRLKSLRDRALALGRGRRKAKAAAMLETIESHLAESMALSTAAAELQELSADNACLYVLPTARPCDSRLYRDQEIQLHEALRERLSRRARWLAASEAAVRELVTQYVSVLRANENFHVQRRLQTLTVLLAILTTVMLVGQYQSWISKFITDIRWW